MTLASSQKAPELKIKATIVHEKPLAGRYKELIFGSPAGNTLWIRFSDEDSGSEWVGIFECGNSTTSQIDNAGQPELYQICAGGFCYIVNATDGSLLNSFKEPWITHSIYDPVHDIFIAADGLRIRAYKSGRLLWASSRIALDGIDHLRLEGSLVKGIAVTGFNGETEPFSVDLETREVNCATDYSSWDKDLEEWRRRKPRPWWKFWERKLR